MRVIAAVAITLAVLAVSLAEETKEDKRTRILKFYKCVSCHELDIVREDYMKCAEMKPQKCKEMAMECKNQIMGDLETPEERWRKVCEDEDVRERLFDCIINHEGRKTLTDDEKTELKAFVKCAMNLSSKHCTNP